MSTERERIAAERLDLQAQRQETQWQLQLTVIYQRARNKSGQILKRCVANENQIRDLHMDVGMFLEAIKRDDIANTFIWMEDPNDKRTEGRDRSAFTDFCKAHRFNDGVAGFNLAREVLGAGNLTEYSLAEAVRTRRLKLAPANADELAERKEERQDKERLRLMNTPAHRLKTEAVQGILDRRKSAQQEDADRVFAEKETRDQQSGGFPPLPQVFRGERLDRGFFVKKCDRETLKFLNQKYGSANVEARIRGIR